MAFFPTDLSTWAFVAVVTIRAFSFWRCRESGDRTLVCAWLSSHEYAPVANGVRAGRAYPGGRDAG
jgi:hypothetical protein